MTICEVSEPRMPSRAMVAAVTKSRSWIARCKLRLRGILSNTTAPRSSAIAASFHSQKVPLFEQIEFTDREGAGGGSFVLCNAQRPARFS